MQNEAERVAKGLTKAQRAALIACVDALSELAGEGFCSAEDAIFDLFAAFDGDPKLTYEAWVRRHLETPDAE
jgi:hypothetical protein